MCKSVVNVHSPSANLVVFRENHRLLSITQTPDQLLCEVHCSFSRCSSWACTCTLYYNMMDLSFDYFNKASKYATDHVEDCIIRVKALNETDLGLESSPKRNDLMKENIDVAYGTVRLVSLLCLLSCVFFWKKLFTVRIYSVVHLFISTVC